MKPAYPSYALDELDDLRIPRRLRMLKVNVRLARTPGATSLDGFLRIMASGSGGEDLKYLFTPVRISSLCDEVLGLSTSINDVFFLGTYAQLEKLGGTGVSIPGKKELEAQYFEEDSPGNILVPSVAHLTGSLLKIPASVLYAKSPTRRALIQVGLDAAEIMEDDLIGDLRSREGKNAITSWPQSFRDNALRDGCYFLESERLWQVRVRNGKLIYRKSTDGRNNS